MFRSVQAGRRARSELLQADRRNRLLELKNYESLLEERTTMSGLYVQIKSWQLREDRLENQFRVKIIRERESRCGFGEDEACDLFYQGWLPTDTIATEGTETMFANPKYVPHFYPPNELIQEQRKHTGLARVRLSLCMEHDLQPDENLRVFDTFGQYEEFYTGMGSKQYMRKTVKQMRKSSLFGPYLEHGHRGYMEGCAVVTELLGLLVSPITVPLQLGYLGAETALEKFWGTLERCVSNEEGNGAIRSICSVLIRMYDVAGIPQQVSNALDITMLNDLQEYIFERLNPFITPPIWIASVMWNTPRMYYNYYWLDLTRQLPVRRDSCLLRSAEESIQSELASVIAKIEDYETKQKLSNSEGPGPTVSKSKGKIAAMMKAFKKQPSEDDVDFGPDNSWSIVDGECIEETFEKYKYKFCFFNNAKQGNTALGHFLGWGKRDDLVKRQEDQDQDDTAEGSKKKKRANSKTQWEFPAGYADQHKKDEGYYTRQVLIETIMLSSLVSVMYC
jgi:hypothetical protein